MSVEAFKIRYYQEGDEDKILKLFHHVFGPNYSLEGWRWQFKENPFSRPIIWVAENQNGELVGHYCLIPVPYYHEGQSLKAAFSILSMIHPDFQRRGLLKQLAEACDRQLKDDRIELGLTFLNDNSLPVYTTTFGWRKVFKVLPVYGRILDASEVLKKYTSSRFLLKVSGKIIGLIYSMVTTPLWFAVKNQKVVIYEISDFDVRFDELWSEFRKNIESGVERKHQYLQWRFCLNPKQYRILAAKEDDQLKGFVVIREEKKFNVKMGYVAELVFLEKHVGAALLKYACQVLKQSGCGMVTGLFTSPKQYKWVLKMHRFVKLPGFLMPHGIHFCEKKLSPNISHLPGRGIYLSWSDHDVV